jgi:hypothetical protein
MRFGATTDGSVGASKPRMSAVMVLMTSSSTWLAWMWIERCVAGGAHLAPARKRSQSEEEGR